MIRVTFDPYYIDDLQDYYHRNECIREQQYLSQEKLLHLAAFCVSKATTNIDDKWEQRPNGSNVEAALDVVRQLSLLCYDANQSDARIEPVNVVNDLTQYEIGTQEWNATTFNTPILVEKVVAHSRSVMQVAVSAIRGLMGRFGEER